VSSGRFHPPGQEVETAMFVVFVCEPAFSIRPGSGGGDRPQQRRRSVERSKKEALVAELHETFETASLVVVTSQSGLTVPEVTDLRQKMRDAGAGYKVTKNTLAKLALKGTKFEHLDEVFTGPTAIAFSRDPVAAAKVVTDYRKTNEKISIVAGGLDGSGLDANQVEALAKLPPLDQLRAKLLGVLQAPATKLAGVVQAPAGQLARVFGAYGSSE
jgi:large subunit ribosomal protein L10